MEKISIREFARRLGCSDTTVRKAIKAGRIDKGHNPKGRRQSIIYEVAKAEWAENFDVADTANLTLAKNLGFDVDAPVDELMPPAVPPPPPPKPEPQPKPAPKKRGPKPKQKIQPEPKPEPEQVIPETPPIPETGKGPTLQQATLKEKVYKAQLSELNYKEKLGTLVNKDEVYKALYAAGQEVREAILAVPDRIIDDVMASRSRNEAYNKLYEELAKALERVAEIENRDISRDITK